MEYKLNDYKIHIVASAHYTAKFVAYIEELYGVSVIIDDKQQAAEKLKLLFEEEIERLRNTGQAIPKPGSGKAEITFASNNKIETLRPFIDDFWDKILGTSYSTSFVSDESYFFSWEHYLDGGKEELIQKVKRIYSVDITSIYEQPIYNILNTVKYKNSFLSRLIRRLKKK